MIAFSNISNLGTNPRLLTINFGSPSVYVFTATSDVNLAISASSDLPNGTIATFILDPASTSNYTLDSSFGGNFRFYTFGSGSSIKLYQYSNSVNSGARSAVTFMKIGSDRWIPIWTNTSMVG